MRGKYYTINVYPNSDSGFFTIVVLQNDGYRIPCSNHQEEPACKVCDRMHKGHVVAARFDEPIEGGFADVHAFMRAVYLAFISGHHSKRQAEQDKHS